MKELNGNKSVKLNAVLNMIKTFLSIVFPLITFPYVSRILQVDNIGKINYTNSIISYFLLIAGLGISTYAVREGARLRNNREKLNEFVSEVFSLNIATTVISYVLLFSLVLLSEKLKQYWLLFAIQSLTIVFTTIGVEWINVIYEDYVYITIRSFLIQILSLIGMFLFVKTPDDYYKYAIITVAGNGLVSVLNIFHIRKYCEIKLQVCKKWKDHIRPILVLFSNNIAVSIYMNSDISMLGWMVGEYAVGLYAVSVKVYSIVKNLIASVYAVVTARMSMYYAEGKITEFKKLLNDVINAVILISIPSTVGMYFTAHEIIVFLSGENYVDATVSLQILSFAFLFAILGGILANCVNLPLKREAYNLKATAISAMVNVGLNIVCIPALKQNGAALTTLIAEALVCIVLFVGLKQYYELFDFKGIRVNLIKCVLSSIPMLFLDYSFRNILDLSGFKYLLPMIISSGLSYLLINVIIHNEYIINSLQVIKRHN